MLQLPQISESEYEVMKVIWKCAPINTNEVTEKMVGITNWSPKTIHTLLKRLVQKGALGYEKDSRVFVYSPLIQEEEYRRQESDHFLKRFYNGNMGAMLVSYLKNEEISQQELNDLKELLSHNEKKGNP